MLTDVVNIVREKGFLYILEHPKCVVFLSFFLFVSACIGLTELHKDTRADAFLASDNPALVYRNKVKEQFGLSDPLVLAVVDTGVFGVFNPRTLAVVQQLSDGISDLDNIDYSRVVSLATEKNIASTVDGMTVTPFFDPIPETQPQADLLRKALDAIPLYVGSMVSREGQATLIVAEMEDESLADESYQRALSLVHSLTLPPSVQVHVAGEGAISGFLGEYIDADAKRLNPLTGVIIFIIILLAYRRLSPALLCVLIIAASVLMTLGLMAASGTPFYIITNALPVILIGISVADAIHVFSHYFELQRQAPTRACKSLVHETMAAMWRPITYTTLTTIGGFLGLYWAAYMPPFQAFGLFCATGVALAWLYSLVFLPAAMVLVQPTFSHSLAADDRRQGGDLITRCMAGLGRMTYRYAVWVVCGFLLLALAGGYAASQLIVDEDRIDIFHPSEAIYKADKTINKYFDGTNALDIVVETQEVEGLFKLDRLRKMEALQQYALSLPHVQGATSIVDYLKQINRALNGGATEEYRLPDNSDLVAQYFLIYSSTSDPTDFEEEIDYDYKTANIRVSMNSGGYQHIKYVVENLNGYIDKNINNQTVHATLSGRVNLNYHWIKGLSSSHFVGLFLALSLVLLVSSLLFRSFLGGVYALIPVAASVLLVYAVMVVFKMNLGVGTSMFAAVAIGLGVDFSIHTLDRFKALYAEGEGDMQAVFTDFYTTTGRALLFNFLAISCGFGILMISKISSLNNFGAIVALAVTASFFSSITLLPALIKLFKPRFIRRSTINNTDRAAAGGSSPAIYFSGGLALLGASGMLLILSGLLAWSSPVVAQLSADAIVSKVNAVDDGLFLTRKLTMRMVDKRGKERQRETISYRKDYTDETRTVLFYLSPANVRNTAFLMWDYRDETQVDDQWLYLPALRKVRRIASADRGSYFLGTDFTYDDIQLDGKLEARDYDFSLVRDDSTAGTYQLSSKPKTPVIAKQLGYSRTEFTVDKSNWMVLQVDFWDLKGKPLKRMSIRDIRSVDNVLTRHQLHIVNHKTGHQTYFTFSEVDYKTPIKDGWFNKRALSRGR